jgi:hypothetical protein
MDGELRVRIGEMTLDSALARPLVIFLINDSNGKG